MRTASSFAALVLLAPLASCDLKIAFFVKDTEGWSYRVGCTKTACDSVLESPHAPQPERACPAGSTAGFALAGRKAVMACHACVSGDHAVRIDETRCRPVTCAADGECVPWRGEHRTRCVQHRCTVPDDPALDHVAAVGMCMAGAGPGGAASASGVADRVALTRTACDDDGRCGVPNGCEAPR